MEYSEAIKLSEAKVKSIGSDAFTIQHRRVNSRKKGTMLCTISFEGLILFKQDITGSYNPTGNFKNFKNSLHKRKY